MQTAELKFSAKEKFPVPKGYKVLVAVPAHKEKSDGGIFLPDKLRDAEKTASIFGYVVSLGEAAYLDEAKFPKGPYCSVGDWVIFRSYTGTRFRVNGEELRLIDDDSIEAVIPDPKVIERV